MGLIVCLQARGDLVPQVPRYDCLMLPSEALLAMDDLADVDPIVQQVRVF
jgi:hypothetical protein